MENLCKIICTDTENYLQDTSRNNGKVVTFMYLPVPNYAFFCSVRFGKPKCLPLNILCAVSSTKKESTEVKKSTQSVFILICELLLMCR